MLFSVVQGLFCEDFSLWAILWESCVIIDESSTSTVFSICGYRASNPTADRGKVLARSFFRQRAHQGVIACIVALLGELDTLGEILSPNKTLAEIRHRRHHAVVAETPGVKGAIGPKLQKFES